MVRFHHTSSPAYRECKLRRYQNKIESLNLQDMQSRLRLRAIEMTREQKIKSIEDRLKSHDLAVELMRKRHANEMENCKELSAASSENFFRCLPTIEDQKIRSKELKEFEESMDEKYKKLVNEKYFKSEKDEINDNYKDRRSLNYKQVKDMLNHLPITPIFKETTYALTKMTKRAAADVSTKYDDKAFPSICNNVDLYDSSGSSSLPKQHKADYPVENYSYIMTDRDTMMMMMMDADGKFNNEFNSIRSQRDVRVPPKDVKLEKPNDIKAIKSSIYGGAKKGKSPGKLPKKSVSFEDERRPKERERISVAKRASTFNGTSADSSSSDVLVFDKENNKLPNFTDFMISKGRGGGASKDNVDADSSPLQKKRMNYRKSSSKRPPLPVLCTNNNSMLHAAET